MPTLQEIDAEIARRQQSSAPSLADIDAEIAKRQQPEQGLMSRGWDALKGAVQGNAEFKDAGDASDFVINQADAGRYKDDGIFTKDRFFQDLLGVQGASVFGNENDVTNELKERFGKDAQFTKDSNGNLMVTDGKTAEYVNKPGLDVQDMANFTGEAISYMPALKVASGLNNPLVRGTGTGLATAATNVINQKGAGRESVDKGDVITAGVVGAGGEVASTYLGKLYGWAANKLSGSKGAIKKGAELASKNNLGGLEDDALEALGKMRGAVDNSVPDSAIIAELQHGLKLTRGQATGNMRQLSTEEGLRNQTILMDQFKKVDDLNQSAVEGGLRNIRSNMYGNADDAILPAASAETALDGLKSAANTAKTEYQKAYNEVGNLYVKNEAVDGLEQRLASSVRMSERSTPMAMEAMDVVREGIEKLPTNSKGFSIKAFDNQRKEINNLYSKGMSDTDKRALTTVKNELDDWFYSSVDDSLLKGNPEQLEKLTKARGMMSDYMNRFQSKESSKKVIKQILDKDVTPEEFSNMLVNVNGYSKAGAANTIKSYKEAVGPDSDAFKALQANVFEKLIIGGVNPKTGQAAVKGYEGLSSAFHNAYNVKGTSMMKELFDNKTGNEIKSLMSSVRKLIKPDEIKNASGSGRLVAQIMSQHGNKFPILSNLWNGVRGAVNYSKATSLPAQVSGNSIRQVGGVLQTAD